MEIYYVIGSDGYATSLSNTPIGDNPVAAKMADEPDYQKTRAYKLKDSMLVLDEARWLEIAVEIKGVIAESDREARYDALVLPQAKRMIAQELIHSTSDPDTLITLMPGMAEWVVQVYAQGDCVTRKGLPYRAMHNIGEAYKAMPPDEAPTLWTALHGRTRDTALPYKQEGHNPYKAGEWIIWTDGDYYECVQDTDHSPHAWPQGWRKDGADAAIAEQDDAGGDDAPTLQPYAVGVAYSVGDEFEYKGKTYCVLQPHTSQAGWPPDALPALYALV